jgi:hypothetical protein
MSSSNSSKSTTPVYTATTLTTEQYTRLDERLNSFMIDVNQKLAKLDILDELNQRLSKFAGVG